MVLSWLTTRERPLGTSAHWRVRPRGPAHRVVPRVLILVRVMPTGWPHVLHWVSIRLHIPYMYTNITKTTLHTMRQVKIVSSWVGTNAASTSFFLVCVCVCFCLFVVFFFVCLFFLGFFFFWRETSKQTSARPKVPPNVCAHRLVGDSNNILRSFLCIRKHNE